MPNYIIQDNAILFRQGFSCSILRGLFVTLYALDVTVLDSGNRIYPHKVIMSESEFIYVLELAEGE